MKRSEQSEDYISSLILADAYHSTNHYTYRSGSISAPGSATTVADGGGLAKVG